MLVKETLKASANLAHDTMQKVGEKEILKRIEKAKENAGNIKKA
jgi:hypothetical protein